TSDLNGCTTLDAVVVTVNPYPISNAGNDVVVCSESSATLGTTLTAGYSYSWTPSNGLSSSTISNPSITLTNTATSPVTFTYIVTTESYGCTTKDSVEVLVKPVPISDAGADVAFCSGGAASIGNTLTAGYSYSWTPSAGLNNSTISNPTVTIINIGTAALTHTYFVTSDLNGCTTLDAVVVTVNPYPISNAGNDVVFCSGSSAILGNSVTAGYSYSWTPSNGLSSSTISNPRLNLTNTGATPLTYTYIVTSDLNDCTTLDAVVVTVNPYPISNAGNYVVFCSGSSATIGTTTTVGYTYSWTPSTGLNNSTISDPIITLTNSGTNAVTYTYNVAVELNGCTTQDAVVVEVKDLPIITSSNAWMCPGSSVTLNVTGGFTYSWSPSIGISNANISNPIASPSITMNYTVFSTGNNGCDNSYTITVEVNPIIPIQIGNNRAICFGESTELGGNPTVPAGSNYTWTPSNIQNNPNITVNPTSTTIYSLTVTNYTCTGISNMTVIVNPLPLAFAGNDISICFGDSYSLGKNSITGHLYNWSSKLTGFNSVAYPFIVNPTVQTTFYLTETILNTGCINSDSIKIFIKPLPIFNIGNDTSLCKGTSFNLNAETINASYLWQDGTKFPTFKIIQPGLFWVDVIVDACVARDSIYVTECEPILEMPNVFTPNNDGVNDRFCARLMQGIQQATLIIYNRWGQKVNETDNLYLGWDGTYDGSVCADGTYTWIVQYTTDKNDSKILKGFLSIFN
ncbi:MAG: gliding motility-associated C-terminal domain-containing protein, partial [Bacteroidota bacterium]